MSEKGFRVEIPVHIKRDQRAGKVLARGETPKDNESVPRIARLLALAWKWEGMVYRAEAKDYSEIARRHGLSRARVSQICSLALVAPICQARLVSAPNNRIAFGALAEIAAEPSWKNQETLVKSSSRTLK